MNHERVIQGHWIVQTEGTSFPGLIHKAYLKIQIERQARIQNVFTDCTNVRRVPFPLFQQANE